MIEAPFVLLWNQFNSFCHVLSARQNLVFIVSVYFFVLLLVVLCDYALSIPLYFLFMLTITCETNPSQYASF